ncbi:MAG: hypothetical protein Q7U57_12355 [Methylovulum sp.]|nr:hypothetical protein [Methylovulum sp.]
MMSSIVCLSYPCGAGISCANPIRATLWGSVRLQSRLLAVCLGLWSSVPMADDNESALALHYFGTAGLVHNTTGPADFIRDLSQRDGVNGGQWSVTLDTVVGVQASYAVNEQLDIVAQGVSRHHYDNNYTPELTWAFVKYSPRSHIELRGGRLGLDFYMRADSRLVGYSYLTVRPSVDYYGALPYQYFDGLDAAFTLPMGEGLLRAKLFGGYSPESIPFENSVPWDGSGSPELGANLDYQWDSWQFRISYAQISHARDFPGLITDLVTALQTVPSPNAQAAADALAAGRATSRHYSAGVVYDEGPLQMQLMASGVKYDTALFQDSIAGYFLAGYRLGEVTPYAGLSWSRSSATRLDSTGIPAFDAAIASAIGLSSTNQHTYTLGLRWDFHTGMDLKVQWDAVCGASDSVFLYRWDQPGWNGQTQVWSAALDFAF